MRERIRLGFLGGGQWGQRNHLPAIAIIQEQYADRFDVEIAALCNRHPEIAEKLSREYNIPRIYDNVEDFAADSTLDCFAVVISPKDLRPVIQALYQRRVAILTEKPPGLTSEDAQYLADTVTVPNVVAFNRRYFPIVERFRRILMELQGVYYVHCNFCRHARYDSKRFYEEKRPNANPFVIGTAIHAINVLEYLFGEIASCSTTRLKVKTNETDAWLADLDFKTGIKGRLEILPCSGSATEWIEVHSQKQSLYLHFCMYSEIDYPGRIVIHDGGTLKEVIEGATELPRIVHEGFVGEYLDFFSAIIDGSPTRSNFRNSANSMRIAEAIEKGVDVVQPPAR